MSKAKIDTRPLRADPLMAGIDTMQPGGMYRRPHGASGYTLVLTRGGVGMIGSEACKQKQTAGDIVLIEPGGPMDQDTLPDRSWQRIWALFEPRPNWYDLLRWPAAEGVMRTRQLHLPTVRRGSPICQALEEMHHHLLGAARQRKELAMNALERALLLLDEINPRSQQAQIDARVREVMDYVGHHLAEPHDVESLAAACDLSASHLARLFRQQVGQTPMQFVESRRMQRAAELLTMTDQTITAIAHAVGFEDAFYFSTRFKTFAGASPRAYRNR